MTRDSCSVEIKYRDGLALLAEVERLKGYEVWANKRNCDTPDDLSRMIAKRIDQIEAAEADRDHYKALVADVEEYLEGHDVPTEDCDGTTLGLADRIKALRHPEKDQLAYFKALAESRGKALEAVRRHARHNSDCPGTRLTCDCGFVDADDLAASASLSQEKTDPAKDTPS